MSGTVFTHSAATMSWIDPRIGLPEDDPGGDPGPKTTRDVITGKKAYRYANLLDASVRVVGGAIVEHGFTKSSGMYRSPSFLGIESHAFEPTRHQEEIAGGVPAVRFRQLVGCRTLSPRSFPKP
jgi:hypothetical protein